MKTLTGLAEARAEYATGDGQGGEHTGHGRGASPPPPAVPPTTTRTGHDRLKVFRFKGTVVDTGEGFDRYQLRMTEEDRYAAGEADLDGDRYLDEDLQLLFRQFVGRPVHVTVTISLGRD